MRRGGGGGGEARKAPVAADCIIFQIAEDWEEFNCMESDLTGRDRFIMITRLCKLSGMTFSSCNIPRGGGGDGERGSRAFISG